MQHSVLLWSTSLDPDSIQGSGLVAKRTPQFTGVYGVWFQYESNSLQLQCPDMSRSGQLIALNMWWIILRLIWCSWHMASAAFFVSSFINIRPDISGRGAEILGDMMMMMRYARIVARFLCCTRNDPLDFLVALRRMPMSHMRTMVLVYKNLHNWVIYGLNVGVRIPAPWFAYGCGLASSILGRGPDHQISPGHHGRRPRNGVQRAGPGQFCRRFLGWIPLELAMRWTWFDWQIWHEIWHGLNNEIILKLHLVASYCILLHLSRRFFPCHNRTAVSCTMAHDPWLWPQRGSLTAVDEVWPSSQ